jgi:hypothetical protein
VSVQAVGEAVGDAVRQALEDRRFDLRANVYTLIAITGVILYWRGVWTLWWAPLAFRHAFAASAHCKICPPSMRAGHLVCSKEDSWNPCCCVAYLTNLLHRLQGQTGGHVARQRNRVHCTGTFHHHLLPICTPTTARGAPQLKDGPSCARSRVQSQKTAHGKNCVAPLTCN